MEAKLAGTPCVAGLDLGSTRDLTALVLLFEDGDDYIVLPWFWCPHKTAEVRQKRASERKTQAFYQTWAKQGWIKLTDGDIIDHKTIRADIGELGEKYRILEIAIDRLFQGDSLMMDLQDDGFETTPFGQGFLTMAAPCKRFHELVIGGKWKHGNNPVLNWMAYNVAPKMDEHENIKPDKKASGDKIDGIVAGIMALGRMMERPVEQPSVYADRGLITL